MTGPAQRNQFTSASGALLPPLSVPLTLAALLAFGGSACSVLLDANEPQCRTDLDCVALFDLGYVCRKDRVCEAPTPEPDAGEPDAGDYVPAAWACLEDEPTLVPYEAAESITLRFVSVNYQSLVVPEALTARACTRTDVNCARPLLDDVSPDAEDYLEFEVPKGFPGYFELTAPSVLPTLFYTNRAYDQDLDFSGPILVDSQTVSDLSDRGDRAADLSKGLVIFQFWDCSGNPASGVTLIRTGGEPGEVFYFDGGLPNRDLTATRASVALSVMGEPLAGAGISNIEPGFESFKAVHVETGLELGTYTVEVRAGYMTTVFMFAGY